MQLLGVAESPAASLGRSGPHNGALDDGGHRSVKYRRLVVEVVDCGLGRQLSSGSASASRCSGGRASQCGGRARGRRSRASGRGDSQRAGSAGQSGDSVGQRSSPPGILPEERSAIGIGNTKKAWRAYVSGFQDAGSWKTDAAGKSCGTERIILFVSFSFKPFSFQSPSSPQICGPRLKIKETVGPHCTHSRT